MDVLIFALCFVVIFFSLAVFANKFRRTHALHFELKPNCLLTRWPVVFVTGPRSWFYFSRYWNLYPVYLAEHGYEVFTVHLPWSDVAQRRERFRAMLAEHKNKKYHFVLDSVTLLQMKDLLWSHPAATSVTELLDEHAVSVVASSRFRPLEMLTSTDAGPLLRFSFWLHRKLVRNAITPSLSTLGALPDSAFDNARLLLARVQELAEEDYQEDATL